MKNQIKNIILSTLVAFFAGTAATAERLQPLLWKAEKNGRVGYFLGTMHAGVAKNALPNEVFEIIQNTPYFYIEADTDQVTQELIQNRGFLDENQSLDELLSPEAWTKLVEILGAMMPVENLQRMKPWYATMILGSIAIQQTYGELPPKIDTELRDYARSLGHEIGYLETASFQLSSLEATNPSNELDLSLRSSENFLQTTSEQLKSLEACYQQANIECLLSKIFQSADSKTNAQWKYDIMFRSRNRNWILPIKRALEKGPSFFAVGAGHLIGEENVLELLEKEGFTIERIDFK